MKSPHFWITVVLLASAAGILHVRGNTDSVPHSTPLALLPMTIGSWRGADSPLPSYVFEVLGEGEFLNRTYSTQADDSSSTLESSVTPPVGLFIGYFPTQRTGQAIHSPQNCLPGAGWTFNSKGVIDVTDDAGRQYRVGDYLISNGTNQDEVLYWYRAHGRTIASDYAAKWHTLKDSVLYGRTDAALVRVITPIAVGESRKTAQLRVINFASKLNPLLSAYIPD
ncbi:MAG: exosortase C-terminal domain/associated protein EpsI [Acidobacteriaceae bacterium]